MSCHQTDEATPARVREPTAQGDRGQVLPLVALGIAVVAAAVLLLGRLGVSAAQSARARTAADAAALAGAVGGEQAADRVARANGGELVAFEMEVSHAQAGRPVVTVTVSLGDHRAVASAVASATNSPP